MDVLMEIEGKDLEGALGKEFVQRGICPELSLGYHVTMSKSPAGFLKATNKRVVELSIVRQGAREGCKIRAFTNDAARQAEKAVSEKLFGNLSDSTQGSNKRHKIIV